MHYERPNGTRGTWPFSCHAYFHNKHVSCVRSTCMQRKLIKLLSRVDQLVVEMSLPTFFMVLFVVICSVKLHYMAIINCIWQ
jgi:hypothetical protein